MSESHEIENEKTEELAQRAQFGEREAFEALFERIAEPLYQWGCIQIRKQNVPTLFSEDIMQETWLRAIEKLENKHRDAPFRNWIFTVAWNVFLEAAKFQRRQRRRAPNGLASSMWRHFEHEDTQAHRISQVLMADERVQSIRRIISELPRDDQSLVAMLKYEGISQIEAAERLGISQDCVSKRWCRLKERLRDKLDPQDV